MIEIKSVKSDKNHLEVDSLKAEGTLIEITSDVLNILDVLMEVFKKDKTSESYVKLVISAWCAGMLNEDEEDKESKEEETNDTL